MSTIQRTQEIFLLPLETTIDDSDRIPLVKSPGGVDTGRGVEWGVFKTLIATPSFGTSVSRGIANDIYIAKRQTGAGTGTPEDPFDGSTTAKLDAILAARSSQVNLNVTFMDDVFTTKGNTVWTPNVGWKIKGAGIDSTILRLDNTITPTAGQGITVIGAPQSISAGITISDMTVDANAPNITGPQANSDNNYKLTPVFLYGNYNTIQRVHVMNSDSSHVNGLETFDIGIEGYVNGMTNVPPLGNLAIDCRADNPHGDYSTGMAIGLPNSGNKLYTGSGNTIFHGYSKGYIDTGGVGGVGFSGDSIINCTADSCNFGARWEPVLNVLISGCNFLNCMRAGVRVQDAAGANNLTILNTFIQLSKAGPYGFTYLVWIDPTAGASNIVLDNITGLVTGTGVTDAHAFQINGAISGQNVTVKNCTIDPYITQSPGDLATDTKVSMNRTLSGSTISNLADSLLPTNLTDLSTAQTVSNKRITSRVRTVNGSLPVINPSADTDDVCYQINTQGSTTTINNPSGTPVDGQRIIIRVKSTISVSISWGTAYRQSISLHLPTAFTGSGETDVFEFLYTSTDSKWDLINSNLGYGS